MKTGRNISTDASALFDAIRKGELEKVKELLAANSSLLDFKDPSNKKRTPLDIATEYGKEEIMNLLVKRGDYVDGIRILNAKALLFAAGLENESFLKRMLEAGYDARNLKIESFGNPAMKTLFENAAKSQTKFMEALSAGNAKKVAELLKTNPELFKFKDSSNNGRTPLQEASRLRNNEIVKILLADAASVYAMDYSGKTALYYAAQVPGNEEVVKLLLKRGADIIDKDSDGRTPLHYAVQIPGNEEMVNLLLKKGANVKSKDNSFRTVLYYAVQIPGNEAMVNLLLKRGAYINDFTELNALDYAVRVSGNEEMVKLLLARGADARFMKLDSISNSEIKVLLEAAAERQVLFAEALSNGDAEQVKGFLDRNPELANLKFNVDDTLHNAVAANNKELVELLSLYTDKAGRNALARAEGDKKDLIAMQNAIGEQIRSKVAHGGGDIVSDTITRMKVLFSEGRTTLNEGEKSERTKLIEAKKALDNAIKKKGSSR